MSVVPVVPVVPELRPVDRHGDRAAEREAPARVEVLRIVAWSDPVIDRLGYDPRSLYVETFWLGILGPSTTFLLRRITYGLEVQPEGFGLEMAETARALGLGERMGKNGPFRRAVQRLCTFELARPHGPGELAVRTRIPPLPLRHLSRLPQPLQDSHRRWSVEHRLPEAEQMRRRARRLAAGFAADGRDQREIESRLGALRFHPAIAFQAAAEASRMRAVQPGSSSWPAGVSPQ